MVLLSDPPRNTPGSPNWLTDGRDWPHRDTSAFLQMGRETWHLQRMGSGAKVLLLHGTGASTHSWAGLLPLLAEQYDTLAIDLPGHGFTQMRPGFVPSLDNVSIAIRRVLEALEFQPSLIAGHSAGAAIALMLARQLPHQPERIVSLNGALKPFAGAMGVIAPMMAKLSTIGGFAARSLAKSAEDVGRVERLLLDTGSVLPRDYIARYATLMRCRGHVQNTLRMMANWNLTAIERICSELEMPVLFVAGQNDRTVPPDAAMDMARVTPQGSFVCLHGLGHLAHEEAPDTIGEIILGHASEAPV